MKEYIRMHVQIALTLVGIVVVLVSSIATIHYHEREMVAHITKYLDERKTNMLALARTTDSNGANETVGSVISDCSRRDEYEKLLMHLGSLNKVDLVKVQGLFESCGSFYAERKALMVMELVQELESYTELVTLLGTIDQKRSSAYTLDTWNELVGLEKDRSTILHDQTTIQERIITLLISGENAQSKEVQTLVQEAQELAQLLTVHDHQIDALRDSLQ